MNTQSHNIVMLEWLLPLLNQQLSQLSSNGQCHSDLNANATVESYKQVAKVLLIVDLPRLSLLASKLSQLIKASKASNKQQQRLKRLERLGKFAHELLKNELIFFVQTGSYRRLLIDSTIAQLTHLLTPKQSILQSEKSIISQIAHVDSERYQRSGFDSATVSFTQDIDFIIPKYKANPALKNIKYQQLVKTWQQQTQKLLADSLAASERAPIMQALIKVCRCLWQVESTVVIDNQRLWFLTELWLSQVMSEPQLFKPLNPLLLRLEQVLQRAVESSPLSDEEGFVERLATDIYLQLILITTDDSIQAKLDKLARHADIDVRFLSYVLTELETIIFALDEPHSLVNPLQRLKAQLAQRGWLLYETQVDQILKDLTASMDLEDAFSQMQWQIERQLQELYSVIYDTEQSIYHYIGLPVVFDPATSADANANADVTVRDQQNVGDLPNKDALKKLSQAFTNIKLNFTDNIQSYPDALALSTSAMTDLHSVLAKMGVLPLQQISNELDSMFAQMATHNINSIGVELTQALAAIIAILERLLDYLAQQVLDQSLIQQANAYIEQAQHLLTVRLATPDADVAIEELKAGRSIDSATTAVVRYDDSGEVTVATTPDKANKVINYKDANSHAVDADRNSNRDNNNEQRESAALQCVRTQLKVDNLQMNEAVHSLFIIEAVEVISDLERFLLAWQQDLQDLSALTELRSSFYALKVSSKIAGAFSISAIFIINSTVFVINSASVSSIII